MRAWDRCRFKEIPVGHYFHDNFHIWQSVRSSEIDNSNLSPTTLVMKCVDIIENDKADYKIGDWVRDVYSDVKFQYIGKQTFEIKVFKYFLIRSYKKHLKNTEEFKNLEQWYEEFQKRTNQKLT